VGGIAAMPRRGLAASTTYGGVLCQEGWTESCLELITLGLAPVDHEVKVVGSAMAPSTKTTIGFCSDTVTSKRLPEDVDRLFDSAGGRGCATQGVEHHEIVDDAVVPNTGGAHSRRRQIAGVGFALVA
jgi:hypothetical protein